MLCGQLQKIGAVARDELLVRGDDRLPSLQRAANDLVRSGDAADEFDDDLHVRVED